MRFFPFGIGLLFFALGGVLASAQPAPPSAEAAFAEAFALHDARLFGEAARAFAAFREAYPEHARTPEALFYGGEAALAAGDTEGAARLLARFRRRHPGHPLAARARLALGEFYFASARYDEAVSALSEALGEGQAPEDAARALLLMGQASLRQGRPEAAVAYLRRVPDEYPRTESAPVALYSMGFAEAERGAWGAAANAFERLAADYRRSPEDLAVGLALAEAHLRTGRPDRAAAEAERRLPLLEGEAADRARFLLGEAHLRQEHLEEAEIAFAAVDEQGPYGRGARLGLGRIAFERGRWAQAAAHLGAAVRMQEEADDLTAEALYLEGLALKREGQLDEAERRLAAVAERRPESPYADAALLERGLLLYETRRAEEAARAFEALLERYPASDLAGEAARMMGEAYAALGDFARAEAANRRAADLGTGSAELREEVAFQRGYALYQQGEFAAAAEQLEQAYRNGPSAPRAGEALFWAAESAFQRGQQGRAPALERAARLFGEFLERFPEHRQADAARYALAWTHFRRGDYAGAAAAFERFLALYQPGSEAVPYTADARLRLADAYLALKRFDAAVAAYGRIAGPGADYAAFQIGQAHANAGRTAEALAAYDRLLEAYPDSPLRAQAQYQKGALYFQQNSYERAIDEYRRVVEEHPGSPVAAKAQYGIGDALYNQGKLREAEAAYRAVLERYPQSPFVVDALSGVQFALAAQGQEDRLDEVVDRYRQQNPNAPVLEELRFRQAEGKFQSGNLEAAVADLTAFLREARDPGLRAAATLYLGRAYAELGRTAEAQAHLRRAFEAGGPDVRAEAAARLGSLYLEAARYREALDLYTALGAEAATPEAAAEARTGQGIALLGLGRPGEAQARFEAVLETAPDAPQARRARLGLARAHEHQGRATEAIRAYQRLADEDEDELGAEAAARLGAAHLAAGDAQAAIAALDRLDVETRYAGHPEQVAEALLVRARAYRRLGLPGPADESYQRILRAYAETPAAATARRERTGG